MDYQNGAEFVDDLHQKYGLLQAFQMIEDYLRIPVKDGDDEEQKFRFEVIEAANRLDHI